MPGKNATPLRERAGTHVHTTSYSVADYRLWSERAAQFDYTVEELQKIGALFWSWVLAGQPPLN